MESIAEPVTFFAGRTTGMSVNNGTLFIDRQKVDLTPRSSSDADHSVGTRNIKASNIVAYKDFGFFSPRSS